MKRSLFLSDVFIDVAAVGSQGTGTSKNNRFNEQNNNSARASRFFVRFFAVPAQLRREMTKF